MTDKVLTTALKRFKQAEDAESDIRNKSLQDLRFRAGEQWDDVIASARKTDARPCLTINRLPQFIRQVTNDARMNRGDIKIAATADDTVETAEIIEGMVRHIQVASNADIAYDTASDNQVTMGFGYIRVITDYCYPDSFEQEIKIKRVKNPFTIYFDPNAAEPDYSDAKWCFVVSDMDIDEFKKEYPNAQAGSDILSSTGDNVAGWMKGDNIRVVEYFEVVETPKTIYLMDDGSVIGTKELKAAQEYDPAIQPVNKRMSYDRKVIWRKMTAFEILEEKPWPGKYIPIVPVLGDDLDIDGKRRLTGMVRDAQDPQRMYNYWSSAQTEAIALAPKAPFIGAEGQFTGYEKFWDTANIKNYSRLVYKPVSLNGQPVPPPQRNQAEPPVQAMVQAIQQASEDLKNTTGIYGSGLGKREGDASGKAILALEKSGDIANYHYVDNQSRAKQFVGVIILDLIPLIYDAPRIQRIVHLDGTSKTVKINQPSGKKDESGLDKIYDVTTGKYDVVVETGPSFSTKRQEAAASMVLLVQSAPELMQIAGDLLVKNLDWPGADEISERLKKMLPPQLQEQDDEGVEIPDQVKRQMQQNQQMIEQLTQALNAAHDQIDQKKDELESKERIAYANNETKLVIETFKAETGANMALMTAELQGIHKRMDLLQVNESIGEENNQQAQPV